MNRPEEVTNSEGRFLCYLEFSYYLCSTIFNVIYYKRDLEFLFFVRKVPFASVQVGIFVIWQIAKQAQKAEKVEKVCFS